MLLTHIEHEQNTNHLRHLPDDGLLSIAICLMMASCQKNEPAYKAKLDINPEPYDLEFDRYEEVLFSLDTNDFQVELMNVQDRYHVFLGGDLNNPDAVQYLKDFATDPFSITLYEKVKAVFSDLKPVQIIDDQLVISLDWYLDDEELYDQIGMPRYMSLRRNVSTLAKEVAEQLYMYYLYEWRKQGQIVGEMVFYGRRDFFVEAMCPELPDSVLLGYSSKQWQWAVENEGQVWADIVGNRRLYDASLDAYMMFFGDGPFTQAYSNDAPSRLGEFFGLNISRSYFSNNEVSLQDLMQRKDLQNVFQDSGYKPKK